VNKEKKTSQALILVTVLLFIISIFLVIFVIVPKFSQIQSLNNDVKSKKEELTLGLAKIDAINNAQSIIKNSVADLALLNVALPGDKNTDEALVMVEKICDLNGLKISSVQIDSSEKNTSITSLTYTLNGSYPSMVNFLSDIQKNIRPVSVESLNITSSDEGLSMTVALSFPYLQTKEISSQSGEAASSPEAKASPTVGGGQ